MDLCSYEIKFVWLKCYRVFNYKREREIRERKGSMKQVVLF